MACQTHCIDVTMAKKITMRSSLGYEVYNLGIGKGTFVLQMVEAFEKASKKEVMDILEVCEDVTVCRKSLTYTSSLEDVGAYLESLYIDNLGHIGFRPASKFYAGEEGNSTSTLTPIVEFMRPKARDKKTQEEWVVPLKKFDDISENSVLESEILEP
ncbi:hypothetical protein Tco_0763579 [Tanacetum coccineum]